MRLRWVLSSPALLVLVACAETAPACPEPGFVRDDRGECRADFDASALVDGGADAGLFDGGGDAGPPDAGPPDAGPCGGECAAPRPFCVETSTGEFACVECGDDDDCADGVCVDDACVECRDHADCTSPEAARCDAGRCVPCSSSEQCAGPGLPICDVAREPATCVACTLADASRCASGSTCDLLTGDCATIPAGSRRTCEPCSNDVQCAAGHACVTMSFEGAPIGAFCLREGPSCARPYLSPLARTSLNGRSSVFCGLNESLTTCPAVLGLVGNQTCPGGTDGECPPGGLCRTLGSGILMNRCTYRCGSGDDCLDATTRPAQSTCGDAGSAESTYCGG